MASSLLNTQPSTVSPGKLLLFRYSAKYKETLPFYDKHPLCYVLTADSGAFYGITLQAGDTVEHALGSTSGVIASNKFELGDFIEIVYEGDAYHVTGMFDTASSFAVS